MAKQATTYHRGEMDIHEQAATYDLVMNIAKYGSLVLAAMLSFLVLWFCTGTGFLGAAIVGVVILALGIFFLRGKAEAH
jgi:hypothetical protein